MLNFFANTTPKAQGQKSNKNPIGLFNLVKFIKFLKLLFTDMTCKYQTQSA